jgi:hypothetical protein
LFALSFNDGFVFLVFFVEVAQDEFGAFEEPANVVPDEWLDDVGANARVVA